MQTDLVFTVIAEDRPGLVERISEEIAAAGGNWVESSMARLGGEFAGIVRVSVPETGAGDLKDRLGALRDEQIEITSRAADKAVEAPAGSSARLELVCQDHPGILRDITRIIAAEGVSIDNLETSVSAGSMQGEALFKASADLRLPDGLTPAALSEALEETAADLLADINLAE